MNPFKTIKNLLPSSKKSLGSASSVIDIPEGSFLEFALGGGGRVSARKAMTFYQQCSAIATSVDKIAVAIEEIKPVLFFPKLNSFEDDNDILTFLRNPNGFETYKEFIGKLSRHWLLKHDSHISLLGGVTRPPLEIYAVKPQLVTAQQNGKDNYPDSYHVVQGPGSGVYNRKEKKRNIHFLDGGLRELYHIQGFSSRADDTQGDSPIEAAALEARQHIQGRYHNLALLKNGGRLSLLVNFKGDDGVIDDDEHAKRKQMINEQYGGPDKAGTIGVISGGEVDINEMGMKNKDMDYANLDKMASQAIYLKYDIPLPLVSLEKSSYNNIEKAILYFYENVICPNVNTLFSGLSKVLLPRYGIDPSEAIITYDPSSIAIIMRQKLDEIEQRRKTNIETANELRALLPNREDLAEGGDVVYQTASNVPLGEDAFAMDENEDE
jgi:HK97 family phage portal protein